MAGQVRSLPGVVTTIIVGGAAAKSTTTDPSQINTGEIALFLNDGKNTRMTEANAAAATGLIMKYKTNKGDIKTTGVIPPNAEVRASQYRAATSQVGCFGYNGSSGAITVANSYLYKFNVVVRETMVAGVDGRGLPHYPAYYKSTATATQIEIANGLLYSFLSAVSPKRNIQLAKAERLMPTTSDSVIGTATTSFTFTKGSKAVSCAGDIDDTTNAGAGGALAVGNYIRVGTTAASPIYKIVVLNTTTNEMLLDAPFQGETVTKTDDTVVQITAANAASLATGIKITGIDYNADRFKLGRRTFEYVTFNLLDGTELGYLPVTNSTSAFRGSGTYYDVAELEDFFISADGSEDSLKHSIPYEYDRSKLVNNTLTVNGYDIWNFHWNDSGVYTGLFETVANNHVIVLVPTDRANDAVYADAGSAPVADDISDVLEVYFDSITAFDSSGAAITTTGNKLKGTVIS